MVEKREEMTSLEEMVVVNGTRFRPEDAPKAKVVAEVVVVVPAPEPDPVVAPAEAVDPDPTTADSTTVPGSGERVADAEPEVRSGVTPEASPETDATDVDTAPEPEPAPEGLSMKQARPRNKARTATSKEG